MSRSLFHACAALVAVALLFGGSGQAAPLHNLLVELVAIAALAMIAAGAAHLRPLRSGELPALLLLAAIAALPLLQLVPLPEPVWRSLPGHELAAIVTDVIGASGPRPLSVDPEATLQAGLYFVAPAAMFLATLRMEEPARTKVALLIVAGAGLSLVLGVLQMGTAGRAFHLYTNDHNGFPTGLMGNRNHQADLLMIGMLFAAALIGGNQRATFELNWVLLISVILAFAAGVIATISRMGLLLLPIAVLGSFSMVIGQSRNQKRGRTAKGRRPLTMLLIFGGVLLAGVMIAGSGNTQFVIDRFAVALSDGRFRFWADALVAARQYLPWGSGLGTFDPVLRSVEDLNRLGPNYVNRAHNDYVQIFLEAGIPGLALVLLGLVLIGWRALRPLPAQEGHLLRRAAIASILILLLHSTVDYPLRTLGLLTLFGFAAGLLFPPWVALSRPRRHAESV